MNCQPEIWIKICRNCSYEDLQHLALTCKMFEKIAKRALSELLPINVRYGNLWSIQTYMTDFYKGIIVFSRDDSYLLFNRVAEFACALDQFQSHIDKWLTVEWDKIKLCFLQNMLDLLNVNRHIWCVDDPAPPFGKKWIFDEIFQKLTEYENILHIQKAPLRKKMEILLVSN